MELRLLGPLSVLRDDGSAVDCGGVKQRSVLAQLGLQANQAVSVDRLAEGVWGEAVPPRHRQTLQTYVSTLRRALEPHRAARTPGRILGHGESYELVAAPDEVDVTRFRRLLQVGSADLEAQRPRAAAAALAEALDLWKAEPLPDLAGQPFHGAWWPLLHEERLLAQERYVDARLALGEHAEVVGLLGALVNARPERERSWEQLALALVRGGRQAEALATLRAAREALLEEHGLDPGPGLVALEQGILRQDPAVLGVRAPALSAEPVPVVLGRSFGREDLVAAVGAAIADGEQVVVLTGPGGVGKTRLALEVAAEVLPEAVWVPFAEQPRDADLGGVVASVLGVARHQLDGELRGRSLVLDNLEHLTGAGLAVARLLRSGPTVLATSRGPLGVPGETVVEVPPLGTSEAAALFRARARALVPSFHCDDAVLAPLVEQLDGLPLALEIAAARVRTLSPQDLLERLPGLGDLRARDGRDARHGSVEAAVRWSVDLLDDDQATALRRLAVLDGRIDLTTASAALAPTAPVDDAVALVERLVDLGLVLAVEGASGRRFQLLRTVRAAVAGPPGGPLAQDAGAEEDVLDAVLSQWRVRDDAQDGRDDWSGQRLARLEDDLDTLRQLTRWAPGAGRADDAAALVLHRRRGLVQLGRLTVMDELCTELVARGVGPPWGDRLRVVAGSARYMASLPGARELLDAVDALPLDDQLHRMLGWSSRAALRAGDDPDGAREDAEAAIAASAGDTALEQVAHSAAAYVALLRGDADAAAGHAEACLTRAVSDLQTVQALTDLATAEVLRGNARRAHTLLVEAVRRGRPLGARRAVLLAQTELVLALVRLGELVEAAALLHDVLPSLDAMGDAGWTLEQVAAAGVLAGLAGDPSGPRLVADAGALARALGLADSAVPDELLPVVEQLGAAAPARDPALPAPPVADLLEEARGLLRSILDPVGPGPGHR